MNERDLEMAEALTDAMRDEQQKACATAALPDVDLTPEQYLRLDCQDCGDDLPEFRMKKGRILCTSCQDARDRARKR